MPSVCAGTPIIRCLNRLPRTLRANSSARVRNGRYTALRHYTYTAESYNTRPNKRDRIPILFNTTQKVLKIRLRRSANIIPNTPTKPAPQPESISRNGPYQKIRLILLIMIIIRPKDRPLRKGGVILRINIQYCLTPRQYYKDYRILTNQTRRIRSIYIYSLTQLIRTRYVTNCSIVVIVVTPRTYTNLLFALSISFIDYNYLQRTI